jgi:hypothetical protein
MRELQRLQLPAAAGHCATQHDANNALIYGNSDNETSNDEGGDGASARPAINVGAAAGLLSGTCGARGKTAAALEKYAVCLGVLVAATASERCASASTASSTASSLQRHGYAKTDCTERQ